MEVQIICPDAATSRLACEGFRSAWRSLHDQCTWATGYQTPEFATAWYRTYAPIAQPLLVIAESAGDKRLVGLLALAQERGSDRIMNVGDHQSEYHAWLANEEVDGADPFIVSALDALRARFPHGSLLFRYLPPGTPTGWLNGRGPWRASVTTRQVSRPLIRLGDGEQIEKTLRKKSNKSRLNRMCKAGGGELTSRTIETEAELATIIDDVARHYDLRQGAVNGVTPSRILDDNRLAKIEFETELSGFCELIRRVRGRQAPRLREA